MAPALVQSATPRAAAEAACGAEPAASTFRWLPWSLVRTAQLLILCCATSAVCCWRLVGPAAASQAGMAAAGAQDGQVLVVMTKLAQPFQQQSYKVRHLHEGLAGRLCVGRPGPAALHRRRSQGCTWAFRAAGCCCLTADCECGTTALRRPACRCPAPSPASGCGARSGTASTSPSWAASAAWPPTSGWSSSPAAPATPGRPSSSTLCTPRRRSTTTGMRVRPGRPPARPPARCGLWAA